MFGIQLVTLAVSGLLGLGYFRYIEEAPGTKRTVCKTSPIMLLAVCAAMAGGPVLLIVALALSALGDAFLAYEGDRPLLGGLSSFLLAHVAYIALFLPMADIGVLSDQTWRLVAGAAVVALSLGMAVRLYRPVGNLAGPVMAYVTVIAVMVLLSLMLDDVMIFAGAMIFMASDTALALRIFVFRPGSRENRIAGLFVWASYYVAQLVLTLVLLDR